MKLIDLEHHFYDASTIDAMAARKGYPNYDPQKDVINWNELLAMPQGPLLKKLLEVSEKRLEMMDSVGITTAVLSTSQGVEELDPSESILLARKANDAAYTLTKKYPGRFLGSAILPTRDVSAACEELERCVKEYGFVAWHTHSNYGVESPEDEKFLPLFQKAVDLGIYVYLHPNLPRDKELLGHYGFTMAGPGAGFTVDTMLAILKLIAKGVFDIIPQLQMVIGHLGEAIPFLMDRIDNRMNFLPNPALKNIHKPSHYFKNNIMVTTSGNMSPSAFACAKEVFGIDHILFGSDYAFESAEEMVKYVRELSLTEEERAALYYKNAEKLGVSI